MVINVPNQQNIMQRKHGNEAMNEAMSFEEGLEKAGYGICQKKVTAIGGLVIFCSFISVGGVSFILPPSQCDLNMTSVHKGTLISAGFIGIILSCHMWGFLSDIMGRRYILMRCIFTDGILYTVTSLMPSYPLFVCVRLIHGFAACGSVVPIYAYVGEFHTDKYRARALLIAAFIASCANIYEPALGWLVMSQKWELEIFSWLVYKPWRLYYALLGIPSLISAVSIYSMPESPKFLLANGKKEKAIEVLQCIHKTNKLKTPFNINDLTMKSEEAVAKMGENRNKVTAFITLIWNQTMPLFRKPNRSNIALVCLVQYLLYFSNNCIFLWLPETINRVGIFVSKTGGESATFCYIIQRFDTTMWNGKDELQGTGNVTNTIGIEAELCSGVLNNAVYIAMASTGILLMLCYIVLHQLANRIRRKFMLGLLIFCGLTCTALLLVTEGAYLIVGLMCLYVMFLGSSVQLTMNAIVDLFPTNIRGMAVCLAILAGRLGSITSNQLSGILIDTQCTAILWVISGSLAVCIVINLLIPSKANYMNEIKEDEKEDSSQL